MSEWEPVIGLEIHVQLNTATKLFSAAPNRFGDEPNSNITELCTGEPGSLPVLNREAVKKAMVEGNDSLLFEESLPWLENFFDLGGEIHPAQFVIMPSGGHWKLRGIPPSLAERMKIRKPLPEAWAGLHQADLKKVSGIPGAIFCHKGRFISIWETKEDALKALHIALRHA